MNKTNIFKIHVNCPYQNAKKDIYTLRIKAVYLSLDPLPVVFRDRINKSKLNKKKHKN